MAYLLGVDAGTTSFKAAIFDEDGNTIAVSSVDYSLVTPGAGIVEFDPDDYWKVFVKLLKKLFNKVSTDMGEIRALAFSSQGETLICMDNEGHAIDNAIVWLDNRSTEEADIIKQEFGTRQVFEKSGQPEIMATWPATKILWIRRNKPELFRRTAKFLLLEDYLIYRLTGKFTAEKSLLCSSLLLDIHKGEWWKEMLDFIGITPERLPGIAESGVIVGNVTGQACEVTGLSPDTLVITGALDQTAGIIGAGSIKPGMICETTGSCQAVSANIDKPIPFSPNLKVTCQYHAIPGKYYLLLWSQTAGMVLKWYKENFYKLEEANCSGLQQDIYKLMDMEAEYVLAGSEGLLMLPHLNGAASPEYNPHAKGVFYGITLKHTRGHFARAIMEAVAYMLNSNIKLLEELEVRADKIYSLGGGARSRIWNKIRADVTGKTIVTLKNKETACLGAAILAGIGSGVFRSFDDACSRMPGIDENFEPDVNHLEVYRKGFEKYKDLYKNVQSLFID